MLGKCAGRRTILILPLVCLVQRMKEATGGAISNVLWTVGEISCQSAPQSLSLTQLFSKITLVLSSLDATSVVSYQHF